jgi:hypothetical protein
MPQFRVAAPAGACIAAVEVDANVVRSFAVQESPPTRSVIVQPAAEAALRTARTMPS